MLRLAGFLAGLNPWLALAAACAVLGCAFCGGWTLNQWRWEARMAEQLKAQNDGLRAAHAAMRDNANDFETLRQELDAATGGATREVRTIYRDVLVPAPPAECAPPERAVSLLNDARQRANAAATGKSGEQLP